MIPKAFNWVANLNSEVSIFIVRSDRGVSSVRDLPSSSLQLGATGLTANNAMYPNVVNQLLGSRLTVVTGYPGAHHVTLALERGEVDGIGGYSWSDTSGSATRMGAKRVHRANSSDRRHYNTRARLGAVDNGVGP